ncbi:MAG: hypothetical protein HRT74_06550 [Flavobacteriales bacterium]|nr:hypothetical protein [Flavobacteriales bacterium]
MKKRGLLLLVSLLLGAFCIQGQDALSTGGARYRALNSAGLTLGDHWSSMQNQAGMVDVDGFAAGVFSFNRFGLSELTTIGASGVYGTGKMAYGLSIESYGFSAWRRTMVGGAIAMKLSEDFDVGVQLGYHQIQLGGIYGSSSTITGAVGFRYRLRDDIVLAAHIFNPTRSQLADFNDERIPTLLRSGLEWKVSTQVSTILEVRKAINDPLGVNFAVEYEPLEHLFIRGGAGTKPDMFSFGLGYRVGVMRIDVASSYHQTLGFLPQLSISYEPQK